MFAQIDDGFAELGVRVGFELHFSPMQCPQLVLRPEV